MSSSDARGAFCIGGLGREDGGVLLAREEGNGAVGACLQLSILRWSFLYISRLLQDWSAIRGSGTPLEQHMPVFHAGYLACGFTAPEAPPWILSWMPKLPPLRQFQQERGLGTLKMFVFENESK